MILVKILTFIDQTFLVKQSRVSKVLNFRII